MKVVIPKVHSSSAFLSAWSFDTICVSTIWIQVLEAEVCTQSNQLTISSIEAVVTVLTPSQNMWHE